MHHDRTWRHYHIDTTGQAVDLDSAYPKIVQGSWIVLANAVSGTIAFYNVTAATQLSRTAFGLSAKITRLSFDTDAQLASFTLPETQVLAQSDLLALASRRLPYPAYGSTLVLGIADDNIVPGQLLGVSGKLQRVMIGPDTTGITFANDPNRTPAAGDFFLMSAAPTQTAGGATQALRPSQLDPNLTPPLYRTPGLDAAGPQRPNCDSDGAGGLLAVAAGADDRSRGERGFRDRRWRRWRRGGPRHHDPVADCAACELL